MVNKILKFFNDGHHGDVFFTRPFLKKIIELNKDKFPTMELLIRCHEDLFLDFDNLKIRKEQDDPFLINLIQQDSSFCDKETIVNGDEIYVNMWSGRGSCIHLGGSNLSRYNFDGYYSVFKHTLMEENKCLPYDEKLYINDFDYAKYDKNRFLKIDELLSSINRKKKILICNNNFFSFQSHSYDFDRLVNSLETESVIFLTNYSENIVKKDNIIFINDLTKDNEIFLSNEGWQVKKSSNLVEISYISNFCEVIIGRDSGPFEICKNYHNTQDENKTFITMCTNYSFPFYMQYNCKYMITKNPEEYDLLIKREIQ
jgi:hypothetical protein